VYAVESAVFDKLTSLKTALFKSNDCIDEDFTNFQSSTDKSRFQTCIDNFNGAPPSMGTASKIFFLLALILPIVW
jgi:hypothetical protein